MGAEERQGKTQFPRQRGQAGQQGDIAHPAARRGVAAGKQPFLFHIQTDDDTQDGRAGPRVRFRGVSAHCSIVCLPAP